MQILGNRESEKILQGQTRILSKIIDDEELDLILAEIVYLLESLAPSMKSSIILLDESGTCLGKAIGPSLPKAYLELIQGVPLGPLEGSCGAAAYLRELVVTSDITTDPRWQKYAELTLPFNLRSCWSMPILSERGKVLGAFAMYYDHVREPSEDELELLKFVVNLAGITIEKKQFADAQKKYEAKIVSQNEELRKINEELDSFVYRASHDIKAPLASLLGIINLASRSSEPGSEMEVLIKHMRKSVASLDHYVEELLDHSRNLRLENCVDRIDVNNLVTQAFDNLTYLPEAAAVKCHLVVKPDTEFYSDQKRLFIILKNLIANAIQYCSLDRPPQINVITDINPLQASIKIQDNGVGIPTENIPKIFQMFYRAAERSTGSGLGLYIVKETVEKLKGQIDVSSEVGVGTTFRIILPNLKQSA